MSTLNAGTVLREILTISPLFLIVIIDEAANPVKVTPFVDV